MAGTRARVPQEVYGQRPSALDKLTGTAPSPGASADKQDRGEAVRQHGNTVLPQEGGPAPMPIPSASGNEKVTFYLRPNQVDKLDELVLAYKRRTGVRINRNELVRRLIDRAALDLLLDVPAQPR